MELILSTAFIKKLIAKKKINVAKAEEHIQWRQDHQMITIPMTLIDDKELKAVSEMLIKEPQSRGTNQQIKKIKMYFTLLEDAGGTKIRKLDQLADALKIYIHKNTTRHWLFEMDDNAIPIAYFVSSIQYVSKTRYTDEHTTIYLKNWQQSERKTTVSFYKRELSEKKSLKELLYDKGYFLDNDEFLEEYERQIKAFNSIVFNIGLQVSGVQGSGSGGGGRWSSYSNTSLVKNGIPAKLVIDEYSNETEGSTVTSNSFWNKNDVDLDSEGDVEETNSDEKLEFVTLPIHPYLAVFHLSEHSEMMVHVDNVEPYIWDKTIYEKLILKEEIKDLISILTQGSRYLMDDIVSGKTGGIIVLATGNPGLGKTLTAEVYSEVIERPLYVVQSSQLGTEPKELEESLKEILDRAARWNAILLIDEADVYIHERGSNVKQNAMVGVFLRVLEYYRGVLFMTSNRATIIDDAIISRATAHIRYEQPDEIELNRIWDVLMKQFKCEPTNKGELIKQLVDKYPNTSGRDIKNMLKLGMLLSREKNKPVDLKTFDFVVRFLNVNITKKEVIFSN